MPSGRRLLGFAVGAALLVALLVFGLASSGSHRGEIAPTLPTTSLSGRPVTLAALRGKPVLVVFWASWCGPCAREAPALERYSRELGGRAELVGVNWDDPSTSEARAFIRRYHWTFPNVRDSEGIIGSRYGLTGLPTTFVIDASGHVRETLRGPQTEQTLSRALMAL